MPCAANAARTSLSAPNARTPDRVRVARMLAAACSMAVTTSAWPPISQPTRRQTDGTVVNSSALSLTTGKPRLPLGLGAGDQMLRWAENASSAVVSRSPSKRTRSRSVSSKFSITTRPPSTLFASSLDRKAATLGSGGSSPRCNQNRPPGNGEVFSRTSSSASMMESSRPL